MAAIIEVRRKVKPEGASDTLGYAFSPEVLSVLVKDLSQDELVFYFITDRAQIELMDIANAVSALMTLDWAVSLLSSYKHRLKTIKNFQTRINYEIFGSYLEITTSSHKYRVRADGGVTVTELH